MLLVVTTTLNTFSLMVITWNNLNHVLMKKLKDGAFVRHIPGIYNATWTDMFIESTYMRLGYGPGRVEPMVTWALSFAICGEFTHDVTKMNNGQREVSIQNDNDDRCIIRSTLTMCINPLNDASHPDGTLVKIKWQHSKVDGQPYFMIICPWLLSQRIQGKDES